MRKNHLHASGTASAAGGWGPLTQCDQLSFTVSVAGVPGPVCGKTWIEFFGTPVAFSIQIVLLIGRGEYGLGSCASHSVHTTPSCSVLSETRCAALVQPNGSEAFIGSEVDVSQIPNEVTVYDTPLPYSTTSSMPSDVPDVYAVELALSVVSQRRNELHSTAGAGAWIDETTEMEDTLHEYCMGIEGPCILLLLLYEFGP